MRKTTRRGIIGILLAVLVVLVRAWLAHLDVASQVVTQVVDGDTVVLMNGERVRLYGVDAPEQSQPFGPEARACLAAMVMGKMVEVHPKGRDRYGRLLAVLVVADEEVNAALVAQGCAWAYPGTGDAYRPAEALARSRGLGLWALSSPIPPWEWRR